ncbi:MAG: hypothetical protein QOH41_765 [Blastocatellia bacterium]|jgi:hypothetical protein|nr:hypothetical protein [Blastocatellia bacterium]
MKNLKLLGISVTLLCVLSMTAFAGATNSPPCAPPDPGATNSPPCAEAQVIPDDFVDPGATNSPPASNSGAEYFIAEAATDFLQSVLLLF